MIQNANDAKVLTDKTKTLEQVLSQIEWAASRGNHCWMFGMLSEEVSAELEKRGFTLESTGTGRFVNIVWL